MSIAASTCDALQALLPPAPPPLPVVDTLDELTPVPALDELAVEDDESPPAPDEDSDWD